MREAIIAEKAYDTTVESQKKLQRIFSQHFGQSWFALFEVYDAPKLAEPAISTPTTPVSSTGTTVTGSTTIPITQ